MGKDIDWAELIIEPGGLYDGTLLSALLACVLDRVLTTAPTLHMQRALAGGAFLLRIAFPQAYPFHPFQLRLITPIYHPPWVRGGIIAVIGSEPYPSSSSPSPSGTEPTGLADSATTPQGCFVGSTLGPHACHWQLHRTAPVLLV
jgi:hypothetical protein